MDTFIEVVELNKLKLEISVLDRFNATLSGVSYPAMTNGYGVYCVARDLDNRKVWATAVTDDKGEMKIYNSIAEALADVKQRLQANGIIRGI